MSLGLFIKLHKDYTSVTHIRKSSKQYHNNAYIVIRGE